MKTLAVLCILAVMVSVAFSRGYDSYNTYKGYPSTRRNVWNSRGSSGWGSLNNGGWDLGHRGSFRHKRAAVGYGSYVPSYRQNTGSHFGGVFNRGLDRLGSNFGWGSNSRLGSNVGWSQYGY